MVSRVIPVDPFDLVIFGGTGDLARRKILPGLFRRFCAGQVPSDARILGAARTDLDSDGYRQMVREALAEFGRDIACDEGTLNGFLDMIQYLAIDARGETGWAELAELMVGKGRVEAFYFSVSPALFGDLAERLQHWGMADEDSRIVVEKPFGHDLASAKELNATLARYFDEKQIYRIDHYLGKETVQNLMAVRFGNMLFEPLWNAQYVDHVQITVAETVGVGGRGEYYDKAGAMRDMVQNHLMQLLCLIAMEPPARFDPDAVRDEKLKVIRSLDPVLPHHIARGQYDAMPGNEAEMPSYREAVDHPRSRTESFIALKTHISNWRWAGTPFYLRTGKRMAARSSEITVIFKDTPHSIFAEDAGRHRNVLSIRLQPNEGITLGVTIKEPGPGGMRLIDVPLDMTFAEALGVDGSDHVDAYERLITDVIRGNQTLFMRGDEVEAAWAWTDPIIEGWEARHDVPKPYDIGSDGPTDSTEMMRRDGREWRKVTP
ncbi:glucose-6-phosphate dehydrogenase [Sulfitobacter mediterraneus]|uniref:glucose-6-phosphate dehydrogenase n=1 Tax=Sulfitobacter mediterraneus TaxID=83219 RepID=UPI001932E8EA|nr:glucose-6-phosphate dehydrogenase [Sulfitobacter mediterraneus]MBM1309511.1 glucose-6-phosphate dehydrogenase [Sulfitobacter mediterraneus]MBM1313396.1 glucose-6-phosphate dehydrogenase [Sulfitobacter mediterraneus]MBM1321780.1 glucose-6-phosphate dehydrogenase [Sulfitobacter mediterraneus]MBM1325667.1 glucose-6-phosphate dehydrogenase [Sulfitobacter mediterraneus]MBM1397013.1 glucose-6-phosphate dehydrogenase [Sulfitobacter mediterraneus]